MHHILFQASMIGPLITMASQRPPRPGPEVQEGSPVALRVWHLVLLGVGALAIVGCVYGPGVVAFFR